MNRLLNGRAFRAFSSFCKTMASSDKEMKRTYEEAVIAFGSLQSNQTTIDKSKNATPEAQEKKVRDTVDIVEKLGISLDEVDKLNVIHVSGTKGKGSTCAFCESILRHHGYKTGFFSSPHLIEVRERVRINGVPLSRERFSEYFWKFYDKVEHRLQNHPSGMPAYFKFITIFALEVFLQEQVDVAIIEVGIGGQYDCTNVLKTPVVCGVTSLGLDHMSLLGDTIEQIAWQKAGIFKPGVPAVTGPQPGDSIQVMRNRAVEIGMPLYFAPDIKDYEWGSEEIRLGIEGPMQLRNASIALQVCNIWMRDHAKKLEDRKAENRSKVSPNMIDSPTFPITEQMLAGLRNCRWPGRAHVVKKDRITYYLDGAHTTRSLQNCVAWFKEASEREAKIKKGNIVKVLLFNATGERKTSTLLDQIATVDFDCAVFCPNIPRQDGYFADQVSTTVPKEVQLSKCTQNMNVWIDLMSTECSDNTENSSPVKNGKVESANPMPCFLFSSIQETITFLTEGRERDFLLPPNMDFEAELPSVVKNADHIQLLVTGSLHLVGGMLRLIDHELTSLRV